MEIFIVILILIGIISLVVYILNLKDVYYAYGRAVGYIFDDSIYLVTYNQYGNLTFLFHNGSSECYMGHLGKSVTKLLKKNGLSEYLEYKETV